MTPAFNSQELLLQSIKTTAVGEIDSLVRKQETEVLSQPNGLMNSQARRIIVATHQLPWSFESSQEGFRFTAKQGHSAQHAGARSLHGYNQQVVNVGWLNLDSSPNMNAEELENLQIALWKEKQSVAVYLEPEISTGHYEGYCKSELWPLFHYIVWGNATDGTTESENWQQYVEVNKRFAHEICSLYREGDLIWIQDYHLLLLPGILRKMLPTAIIGFFLHTPFPSSELFRCLPNRVEILSGVLGANLIGFQTYSHAVIIFLMLATLYFKLHPSFGSRILANWNRFSRV